MFSTHFSQIARSIIVLLGVTGALTSSHQAQARPQWTPVQAMNWNKQAGNTWLRGSNFFAFERHQPNRNVAGLYV